jgi:uncharacterized protein YgiB involved in biofilm formation
MRSRPRKSSACVTLVLIGAAAVAGCSPADRKHYATKEECVADGGDPADCEQQVVQERDGTRRHYYSYSGSGYNWGSGRSPGAGGRSVARGGFGASGHAHASGS